VVDRSDYPRNRLRRPITFGVLDRAAGQQRVVVRQLQPFADEATARRFRTAGEPDQRLKPIPKKLRPLI
jgi:hypothetical protein